MDTQNEFFKGDFDYEGIILRRADPDDTDQIINLQEIGKDDAYNRVYSYPRILKLIESAYLAISVLDGEGNVVAFAAFEDYPQGMRGMIDDRHFNLWEHWFHKAFKSTDLSALNTLWLSYFVAGGTISYKDQHHPFKKILQTVYQSMPEIIGILFLSKGDAGEDDVNYCFDPLRPMFNEIECVNSDAMHNLRGIDSSSKVFFSSRVQLMPFIEIRQANQEDHDDLADIFNNQSETVTEAYGEYFLAELIAAQNEKNRALVAQVRDKAVGLMGLTDDVDTGLLHQCFELQHYDNLLKPELMDAIMKRREHLGWEAQYKAETERIEFLKKMKNESIKSHLISLRISLQEYILEREDSIMTWITELTGNDERLKAFTRGEFEAQLESWISEFKLAQPSQFLSENAKEDNDLTCCILSESEFLLQTLRFFGLPEKYLEGEGHFPNWEKERLQAKEQAKKKQPAGKGDKKMSKVERLKKEREKQKKGDSDIKPTYFDITIFQKCLQRFCLCNGQMRSNARRALLKDLNSTHKVFVDKDKKLSFKKVVNAQELAMLLAKNNQGIDDNLKQNLGPVLMCFGEIEYIKEYGMRVPPDTEEERRQKVIIEMKIKEYNELKKEAEAKGEKLDEDQFKIPVMEQKQPVLTLLHLISIVDLKYSCQKMFEFDKTLFRMGIQKFDINDEEKFMEVIAKKFKNKIYDSDPVYKMPIEPTTVYSDDPEIQKIAEDILDINEIPDVPDKFKNAFACTLFCMEAAFDSRSTDFLKHAFDLYPNREYLIVTQPHTVVESQLLAKFTRPTKKSINTFQHILYIMHRDFLYADDMIVQRIQQPDLEDTYDLIQGLEEEQQMKDLLYDCALNPAQTNYAFVAKVMDQIIGAFVITKDVNLDYYVSHFHVQDHILISEQDRKSHTRLLYSCVNPIFEKSTRFILKEMLRLTQKTCLYFEVEQQTILPTIFNNLVPVRSRRFPHFLQRKWDHERFESEDTLKKKQEQIKSNTDGCMKDPLDEVETEYSLCFTTRRILSDAKIVKNSRIVVVGASDTSISFIEALLSINYIHFTSIVLIAPGGIPNTQDTDETNLKSVSTSYTPRELRQLMLENRVNVIDGRMVDLDRSDKNVILHDDTIIPYDTLVFGMGIQDKTLNSLGYASRGIATPGSLQRTDQILSIDDPYLYDHLRVGGSLINILTDKKRVKNCVIYGRTLNTYCCIKGLIHRGVKPQQIILAVPAKNSHVQDGYDEVQAMEEDLPHIYPEAFDDPLVEEKIMKIVEKLGVTVYQNVELQEIEEDKDEGLESIVFKRLDIVIDEDEEEEDEDLDQKSEEKDSKVESNMNGTGEDEEDDDQNEAELVKQKKKRKKNEMEIECRVLITSGHKDVDQDVFHSIHNNGLVYNGRLIVDKNFQTTDPSIFAAGSLCEFSGRYKAISNGKPLRLDRYNGREMGSRMARSIFDVYDPQANQEEDFLPNFYLPQGQGGVLPGCLYYYNIKTSNPLLISSNMPEEKNRPTLTCDNLDVNNDGHFIQFTFNSIGLVDSVTYMGTEQVVVQSLWSFVGLHEGYLNELTSRYEQGIIPNVAEFLSENWAIALYHEWFGDFCLRMRQSIQGIGEVQNILQQAFEASKECKGISREQMGDFRKQLDPKTVRLIQDDTLEFIKTNMNHLPMYYIPQREFE